MTKYSQRDPKWKDVIMGNAPISTYGCLITCLGIISDIQPDIVDSLIDNVDGYSGNYLIWEKLDSINGFDFIKRVKSYNNEDVSNNLPCLVEVDGTPIGGSTHWVVFIGDKKIIDPWDGKEKNTSAYTPIGYAVVKYVKPGTVNLIEQLPKDSVVRDILNALCGSTSDDEVNAYLKSGKNINEVVTDICTGNERFKAKWIPTIESTQTAPNQSGSVTIPETTTIPSDAYDSSSQETPISPSFLTELKNWIKSLFS